jgi:uncharacterized membrane protein YcaP (DUF421 family)
MVSLISKTMILYVMVVLAIRVMGKKQISELQPSELVTTIIISNIVTISLEESNIPLMAGIIPIILIVCMDILITGLNLKSNKIRKITSGTPVVIISDGTINQKELQNLGYTIDDIMESMRESSIFDLADVQYAIVENTGKINFLEKSQAQEADPQTLVIKDGQIIKEGLQQSGQTKQWLTQLLNEKHACVKDVFLMTADKNGAYNFILKQRR